MLARRPSGGLVLQLLLLVAAAVLPRVDAGAVAAGAASSHLSRSKAHHAAGIGQGKKPLPPQRAGARHTGHPRQRLRDESGQEKAVARLLGARGGQSGNYYGQGGGYGGQYGDDGYDDAYGGDDGYGGYEGGGYGSRQQPPPRQRRPPASRASSSRSGRAAGRGGLGGVGFSLNEPMPPSLRRAGFTLLGASLVLTMMGVSLFFERNLLRLGNLCLILGLPLYFGPGRVMRLLFNKDKLRASACFCLGVFLVLRGNSFLGTLLEVFGFFNLFANMFPLLLALLRNVPVVGELLKRPEPSSGRRDYYRQDDYDRGGGGGRGRW